MENQRSNRYKNEKYLLKHFWTHELTSRERMIAYEKRIIVLI